MYEAIEAGAIPVFEANAGGKRRLVDNLPPEYLTSGMLVVEDWKSAPAKMLELWGDPVALAERQQRLGEWYRGFMTAKLREIESQSMANVTVQQRDQRIDKPSEAVVKRSNVQGVS